MDWQAKWIWAETQCSYVYARREFECPAVPGAEAFVTCTSHYKLYLNGKYVGRGPGPSSSDAHYYDTRDLSHALRPGKNVVAAICHHDADSATPAGFLLQLDIHRNGDDRTVVCTDETWRVKAAQEWGACEGFAEVYDSSKKPVGWNVVGFDDASWQAASVVGDPGVNLVPRQIPPLKEWDVHPQNMLSADGVRYARELLTPSGEVAVANPGAEASVVLDFGMEVVGFAGLKIRGGGCGTIELSYSEALDEQGGLKQGTRDQLALHGGRQEWQAFSRRAFRYVQLTFRNLDIPISLEAVYLTRIGYPVEQVSSFRCSDDLLNEIWRTGLYTLSLCMQDCYESCAGRSAQNAVDARLQALFNYYCFFDSSLAAQALAQTAAGAQSTEECAAWIEMLHEYYLYTADLGLVTQLYPDLQRIVARHDASGHTSLCQALRSASKLAVAASNTEDAERWHGQAASLEQVASEDEQPDMKSPVSLFHALRRLVESDRTQDALDLIRSVWGNMLSRGATTWWESFSPEGQIGEASRCRGASGAPTYFLPAEILGVKPGLPGSGVIIQPRPRDLQWAQGQIKTVTGDVRVEWRADEGVFSIDIEAPPGFMVALPIHGLSNPKIEEIDLTPDTPERRARKTYGWGNTIWCDGQEHDPYLDWLATQEAEPPADYERLQRCTAGQSYVWVRESISTHVRYEVHEG